MGIALVLAILVTLASLLLLAGAMLRKPLDKRSILPGLTSGLLGMAMLALIVIPEGAIRTSASTVLVAASLLALAFEFILWRQKPNG